MSKCFLSFLLSCFLGVLIQSCSRVQDHPEQCFSKAQQDSIIRQSVYYSVKLAPGATQETRFNSEFNWYYDAATKEYDWRACLPGQDSIFYFLMTRKARSIWPAREALGGKIRINSQGKIQEYEEVFRTWKMAEDSLNPRARELFDLMVAGKDLTPYRSKYKGDRYIEFPDDRFYFDKQSRGWRDRVRDSLNIH
jgi:hypothetical protein